MIIDCVADTHGYYPKLEGGDLLIVAGDLTRLDTTPEMVDFADWLDEQKYTKKIVLGGNHDNKFEMWGVEVTKKIFKDTKEYLCDSGTEFEDLKIWGSPWSLKFKNQNPLAMAFTCDTEEELARKWELIPDDVDILITHSPPYGIRDLTVDGRNVGSLTLYNEGRFRIRPQISIFGHIHEAYGKIEQKDKRTGINHIFINASHVNEHYKPVNKPQRIIL